MSSKKFYTDLNILCVLTTHYFFIFGNGFFKLFFQKAVLKREYQFYK
jgi:hypothetical protein